MTRGHEALFPEMCVRVLRVQHLSRTGCVLVLLLVFLLISVQDRSVGVRVARLAVSRPVGDHRHQGLLRVHAVARWPVRLARCRPAGNRNKTE